MGLVRIRWQETGGDKLQGVLNDAYLPDEVPSHLEGPAADWLPV